MCTIWLLYFLVNVIWRTLLTMLIARYRLRRGERLALTEVSRVRVRTLPTDIDLLLHMNNGRYLSLMDLGRWDLLVRTGLASAMHSRGWYAVVAAETITFRKSLQLWQRFEIESKILGHDDRAFYLEHRAVVAGEVFARVVVRARILRRGGGVVPHEEVFAAVGQPSGVPDIEPWVTEWAAASALPSRGQSAPSVWG